MKIEMFLSGIPWPSTPTMKKRWLAWAADFIWDLEPWETEDFDYTPYLEKLKTLGFKGTSEYQMDLDDEKWMK